MDQVQWLLLSCLSCLTKQEVIPHLRVLHYAYQLVALSIFDSFNVCYWRLILDFLIHESEWRGLSSCSSFLGQQSSLGVLFRIWAENQSFHKINISMFLIMLKKEKYFFRCSGTRQLSSDLVIILSPFKMCMLCRFLDIKLLSF